MKDKKLSGAWALLSDDLDSEDTPLDALPTKPKREAKEAPSNKPVSKRAPSPAPKKSDGDELIRIDPSRVRSWAYKDRQSEDLADLSYDDLMRAIARNGQHTPITVRRIKHKDYDYEEIAGFRRLNVCIALGIPVLAIVRTMSDQEGFATQISENDDRQSPSFWRRAQVLKKAMDEELFPTVEAMSIKINIARSTIANYIRVARYMPKLFKEKIPLQNCPRDVLFFLASLQDKSDDYLGAWLKEDHADWRFSLSIRKDDVEKSYNRYAKKSSSSGESLAPKKDSAKTYTGKAGRLFSVTRKGEQVLVNILKDGKRIMTDDELAEALVKIMDDKVAK
jgi:ParB/RepB/Spo0J family partition protein